MNDLGIDGEGIQVSGHPVVETHAQGNDQIGVQQGAICFHRTVHAHHAKAQWIIHRHGRKSVERKGHGNVGFFREGPRPGFTQNFNMKGVLGDPPVSGSTQKSIGLWMRHKDGSVAPDALSVLALADAPPWNSM